MDANHHRPNYHYHFVGDLQEDKSGVKNGDVCMCSKADKGRSFRVAVLLTTRHSRGTAARGAGAAPTWPGPEVTLCRCVPRAAGGGAGRGQRRPRGGTGLAHHLWRRHPPLRHPDEPWPRSVPKEGAGGGFIHVITSDSRVASATDQ